MSPFYLKRKVKIWRAFWYRNEKVFFKSVHIYDQTLARGACTSNILQDLNTFGDSITGADLSPPLYIMVVNYKTLKHPGSCFQVNILDIDKVRHHIHQNKTQMKVTYMDKIKTIVLQFLSSCSICALNTFGALIMALYFLKEWTVSIYCNCI